MVLLVPAPPFGINGRVLVKLLCEKSEGHFIHFQINREGGKWASRRAPVQVLVRPGWTDGCSGSVTRNSWSFLLRISPVKEHKRWVHPSYARLLTKQEAERVHTQMMRSYATNLSLAGNKFPAVRPFRFSKLGMNEPPPYKLTMTQLLDGFRFLYGEFDPSVCETEASFSPGSCHQPEVSSINGCCWYVPGKGWKQSVENCWCKS